MIKTDGNIIFFGGKKIKVKYSIKKILEFGSAVVILMYDDVMPPNNVLALDSQGNVLWMINDILRVHKPTGNVNIEKISDNILYVYSGLGIIFVIDVEEKRCIKKIYVR